MAEGRAAGQRGGHARRGGDLHPRNQNDPDEIIAFGLVEATIEEMKARMDPEVDKARQEAMAPYIESTGADGIYDVIERIDAKSTAQA